LLFQSLFLLIRKIEPALVILLIIFSIDPNVPDFAGGLIRLGSYLLLFILCVSILIRQGSRLVYIFAQDLLPGLLVVLCLLSYSWSSNPDQTLDAVLPLVRTLIWSICLTASFTPKELMKLLAWAMGIIIVSSFAIILVSPSYGVTETFAGTPAWIGIYKHKQILGRHLPLAAISFLNLALSQGQRRWIPWFFFGLTICFILLSSSKSSLLMLLVALSILPIYSLLQQHYKVKALIGSLGLILFFVVMFATISNLEFIVVDLLGKNMEFNGRTPVWAMTITRGLEHPWLGYGYGAFWHSVSAEAVVRTTWLWQLVQEDVVPHAHNDFIEIFLHIGLVGLVLAIVSFIKLISRIIYLIALTNAREFIWMFQFLTVAIFAACSESNIFIYREFIWAFYVAFAYTTALYCYRLKINGIVNLKDEPIKSTIGN
jgi:exopolysaccharide production protein ExoQ